MIIRVRMSIHVPDDAPRQQAQLNDLKVPIQNAVASSLPDSYKVETCKVTRINVAKPTEPAEEA